MKLKAKNSSIYELRSPQGKLLHTWFVDVDHTMELDLDDFEVIECECIKYCWSEPSLRKTWCSCKHGTKEIEPTQKPIEKLDNTSDTAEWIEVLTEKINEIVESINKLQENQ